MSFYKNALTRDGWRIRSDSTEYFSHFYWVDGCPVYGLDVTIVDNGKDAHEVELELSEQPCR
jgi:hypothetical protein